MARSPSSINPELPTPNRVDLSKSKGQLALSPTADTSAATEGKLRASAEALGDARSALNIKSASDLFFGGVKVVDDAIKSKAVTELRAANDTFNAGLDSQTDIGGPAFDTEVTGRIGIDENELLGGQGEQDRGTALPPAIVRKIGEFDRRKVGVEQGRQSEIFFLDKLDKDVKALKSRFPGHIDFIDGEASRLTGTPSANSIRNRRRAIFAQSQTLTDKKARRDEESRNDLRATGHYSSAAVESMTGPQARRTSALIKGAEADRTRLEEKREREQGDLEVKGRDAQSYATRIAANTGDHLALMAGKDGMQAVRAEVAAFRANPLSFSPEARDELVNRVAALSQQITQIDEEIYRTVLEDGTTVFEAVKAGNPTGNDTILSLSEAQNSDLKNYLREAVKQDGDESLMKSYSIATARKKADEEAGLYERVPQLRTLELLKDKLGEPAAQQILQTPEGQIAVGQIISSELGRPSGGNEFTPGENAKHIVTQIQKQIQFGRFADSGGDLPSITQGEASAKIVKAGGSASQQAAANRLLQTSNLAVITNPRTSKSARQNAAKFLFNPQDRSYLLGLHPREHGAAFNMRYNATIAKAILDTGDQRLIKQYKLQASRDFQQLQSSTDQEMANATQNSLISVFIDPETSLIRTQRHPEENLAAGDDLAISQGTVQGADRIQRVADEWNRMALQYQQTMDAVAPAELIATGQDDTALVPKNNHVRDFLRATNGIPETSTIANTGHVPFVKALVATPVPSKVQAGSDPNAPSLGDPEGIALLNTGRSEDDGGQTATVSTPEAAPSGDPQVSIPGIGAVGTPQEAVNQVGSILQRGVTEAVQGLGEGAAALSKKVFGADDPDGTKLFQSLLSAEGPVEGFPEATNQGILQSITKFLTEGNPTEKERHVLEKIEEQLSGPEDDTKGEEDIPIPFANPQRAPAADKEANTKQKELNKDSPPLPVRKPKVERSKPVQEFTGDILGAMGDVLSFIAKGEGGYDSSNNGTLKKRIVGSTHNTKALLGKGLTEMTIGEIMELQKGTRGTGRKLFAVGRYQIIPNTMPAAVKEAGLRKTDMFSEENQDRLGVALIMGSKRPKLAGYIRGDHNNLRLAMLDFAREWASLPHPDTGNSVYGSGNKSGHSRASVRVALKAARAKFASA